MSVCALFVVAMVLCPAGIYQLTTTKIVYASNGGEGEMPDQVISRMETAQLSENTFRREGYDFEGWSTTPTGEADYENSQAVTALSQAHTVILYADWKPKQYQVSFDAGGGEGQMDSQTMTVDETVPVASNAFHKYGYTFAGWSTSEDGKAVISDEEEVSNLSLDEDVTLYATWAANEYTVEYDTGVKDVDLPDRIASYDEDFVLPGTPADREGYEFQGWILELIQPETSTSEEDAASDAADAPSEDVSDEDAPVMTEKEAKKTVDDQEDVSINEDGEVVYQSGAQVKNLSTGQTVKLVADWKTPVEIRQDKMIDWCMEIVAEGYYYGHGYCHTCNPSNAKKYDCTGFLRAALAHGVGDERWRKACAGEGARHGDPPEFCRYLTQTGWECIGSDASNTPQRGDIIAYTRGRIHHVSLYLGDGKIVHCSSMIGGAGVMDYYYGRGESRTIYRMIDETGEEE